MYAVPQFCSEWSPVIVHRLPGALHTFRWRSAGADGAPRCTPNQSLLLRFDAGVWFNGPQTCGGDPLAAALALHRLLVFQHGAGLGRGRLIKSATALRRLQLVSHE
jgi:hypothetical protein